MFGEYSYFSEALWGIFPKIKITRDPQTPLFVQNSGVVTYCKFDQISATSKNGNNIFMWIGKYGIRITKLLFYMAFSSSSLKSSKRHLFPITFAQEHICLIAVPNS